MQFLARMGILRKYLARSSAKFALKAAMLLAIHQ
jgi:hypothetical protein